MRELVLIAALVVSAATAHAEEPCTLRWTFKKGESLRYRMTDEQRQAMAGAATPPVRRAHAIVFREDVLEVSAEGAATIAATYQAVKVDAQQPGMRGNRLVYDSTHPDPLVASHPAIRPLAAFVGESVTFTVDAVGRVGDVRGFDRIARKACEGMGDGPAARAFAEGLERSFGNDAMRDQLESAFRFLPDRPVRMDDTWPVHLERKVERLGALAVSSVFTFQGFESRGAERCALLRSTSAISFAPVDGPRGAGGPPFDIVLESGVASGTIDFGAERGRLVRNQTHTQLDFRLLPRAGAHPGPGAPTGTADLSQHVESDMTLELIAPEAPPF